jgi:hypothetical protein
MSSVKESSGDHARRTAAEEAYQHLVWSDDNLATLTGFRAPTAFYQVL